jgi:hypothetical protein
MRCAVKVMLSVLHYLSAQCITCFSAKVMRNGSHYFCLKTHNAPCSIGNAIHFTLPYCRMHYVSCCQGNAKQIALPMLWDALCILQHITSHTPSFTLNISNLFLSLLTKIIYLYLYLSLSLYLSPLSLLSLLSLRSLLSLLSLLSLPSLFLFSLLLSSSLYSLFSSSSSTLRTGMGHARR